MIEIIKRFWFYLFWGKTASKYGSTPKPQEKENLKESEQLQERLIKITSLLEECQELVESKTVDKIKLNKWSKRIRNKKACDICSTVNNLTAHHLWDKNRHPTLMYQDENGVCLCDKCHKEFHRKYRQSTQVTPALYKQFKTIKELTAKGLM